MRVYRGVASVPRDDGLVGDHWTARLGVALVYATTDPVRVRTRVGLHDLLIVGESDSDPVGDALVVDPSTVRVIRRLIVPAIGTQADRERRILAALSSP